MGTTVDPPPHRRPGVKSVQAGASDDETRASKSPESDLSSIPVDLEPLDSEVPQTPKKKSNKVVKTMVFDNQDGRLIVWVHKFGGHGQDSPVAIYPMPVDTYTIICQHEGGNPNAPMEYVARLSQILPDAFEENSPMKARSSSKIYHRVKDADVYLGSVEKILQHESRNFKMLFLDHYVLDTTTVPGSFICHIWCDNMEASVHELENAVPNVADPGSASAPSTQATPLDPPPLHLKRPTNYHFDNLSEKDKADFVSRLRDFIFEDGNEAFVWGRAKTMAVVVLQRRAMLDAHELLEGRGFSGGSEGGFKIPEDITATKVDEDGKEYEIPHPWTGLRFTATQVELVLKIKHGVAQSDRNHFDPKTLLRYPKIADWLKDPKDSQYSEKFNNMTASQFDVYKARKSGGKVKALLSRESGPSKKKLRTVDDDDSEEEVQPASKKWKGKQKAKGKMDSSDLDSDSD
ncbi:hypothetical protein FIBSPDRAFT_895028 [Athelia psychrophila]|uniref:Uncharacterized protein n=1 Tax=Athelia psychrophila TaxID=1759441 RepID=A0A166F528_9AGAM|nr:hypothetical protein FIBSPDRAFT_895028 [Fibularhizoctonia sp. CBS 109695]